MPEEDEYKISPALQITDRSGTEEKVILPNYQSKQSQFPASNDKESIAGDTKNTVANVKQAMVYLGEDFKFLTTIILLLCTIGAIIVYFPKVNISLLP